MCLLKWVVGIPAISAGALLAKEKAPQLSFGILVGLAVSYLGNKLLGGRPDSGLAPNSPPNSPSSVFKEDPRQGPFRGLVVVPEAATREGDSFSVDERADHFSISKPDNETSRRFTAWRDLLHNIANNLKEEIKTRDELCQEEEARDREKAQPRNLQHLPKQMVGIDFRVKQFQSKLENVTMLGLVGMGGVGKTTLAMAMFNELSPAFEYTCLVPGVKTIKGTVDEMKEAVWKHMHWHGRKVKEEHDWCTLRGEQLLLVLDDISDDRDIVILTSIAKHSSLESRFIATSRDRELLKQLENIYEVPFLDEKDSKELFMNHAFAKDAIMPPPG